MDRIIPSEAVYGFAAWLTSRKDDITFGAKHDSAVVAELVKQWCDSNHLEPPRNGVYPENLTFPKKNRG